MVRWADNGAVLIAPSVTLGTISSREGNDLNKVVETSEIVGISCVQRKVRGTRGGGDEQVYCSSPARLSTGRNHGRVDATVCACGVRVERQWIECGFSALETVLPSSAFVGIGRGMGASREFGHRDRADCDLDGQLRW